MSHPALQGLHCVVTGATSELDLAVASAMPDADHSRWPKLEQVAATILFLASPDNTVTRGAIVSVRGGS